jgi:hypothetical protein
MEENKIINSLNINIEDLLVERPFPPGWPVFYLFKNNENIKLLEFVPDLWIGADSDFFIRFFKKIGNLLIILDENRVPSFIFKAKSNTFYKGVCLHDKTDKNQYYLKYVKT